MLRKPGEDGRPFPRVPVDPRLEAFGNHTRQVAEDPAAGHVRKCPHVCSSAQPADLVDVQLVRSQQEIGIEIAVADQRTHKREPVRVDPARAQAHDHVAGRAARPVDQTLALDDPDACPCKIELLLLVDARQLGRLTADQRAARRAAYLRGALHELGDLLEVDAIRGDVIEQEEGIRSRAEDVVDAVSGKVHAGPAQSPGSTREHELRADAVRRGGEKPTFVERIEAREPAEADGTGRCGGGAQALDDRLRGRERDTGCCVRPALPVQRPESTRRAR